MQKYNEKPLFWLKCCLATRIHIHKYQKYIQRCEDPIKLCYHGKLSKEFCVCKNSLSLGLSLIWFHSNVFILRSLRYIPGIFFFFLVLHHKTRNNMSFAYVVCKWKRLKWQLCISLVKSLQSISTYNDNRYVVLHWPNEIRINPSLRINRQSKFNIVQWPAVMQDPINWRGLQCKNLYRF